LAVRDIAVDMVGGQSLQATLTVIAGVRQIGGVVRGILLAH
jgi:hypothetical protein